MPLLKTVLPQACKRTLIYSKSHLIFAWPHISFSNERTVWCCINVNRLSTCRKLQRMFRLKIDLPIRASRAEILQHSVMERAIPINHNSQFCSLESLHEVGFSFLRCAAREIGDIPNIHSAFPRSTSRYLKSFSIGTINSGSPFPWNSRWQRSVTR
jgi:hypothetical protein